MDRAERWVAISDGGAGIEDWLRANFPRVGAVILDFYHAAEHLCAWAEVLNPDEAQAERAGAAWCHRLKHEGGRVVLDALRAIDLSAGRPRCGRRIGNCWSTSPTRSTGWITRRTGRAGG